MLYQVIKDVVIDGNKHSAGETIRIKHDLTDRLVMLGYIQPYQQDPIIQNRVVTPARKRGRPKAIK